MGLPGLTKFINDRAVGYFETYELHDGYLIIDGHSLSCQLYNWSATNPLNKSRCSYGGDYDKYARTVEHFFRMLLEVNVEPIVVFDGGFETSKLPTILKRMQEKLNIAENMAPYQESRAPWKLVFPLFLREVFKDVVRSLDVKMVMCEYEADQDIANAARSLNCPVVTFDSDYYLFGANYIPFKMLRGEIKSMENWRTGSYKYIPCKLYKIEKLLAQFPGLKPNTLRLLPMILGNDCIVAEDFQPIAGANDKVKAALEWLQKETVQSAIKKLLEKSSDSLQKIHECLDSYCFKPSEVLKCLLQLTASTTSVPSDNIDLTSLGLQINEHKTPSPSCQVFSRNFSNCLYPSSFMNILVDGIYYCIPQIENHKRAVSHEDSYELLGAIYKILSQSEEGLTVVARVGTKATQSKLSGYPSSLPSVAEIEDLTLQNRRQVLLKILNIENTKVIDTSFPVEWQSFLLALKYASCKFTIEPPLLYSLILCFIMLTYVEAKIDFFRSYRSRRENSKTEHHHYYPFGADKSGFHRFPHTECSNFMEKMLKNFNPDNSENADTFDRELLHEMARVQSVFLHFKYLNNLLKCPYTDLLIHKIFNATFIYNLTNKHFRNIFDTFDQTFGDFLRECPNIFAGFKYSIENVNKFLEQ